MTSLTTRLAGRPASLRAGRAGFWAAVGIPAIMGGRCRCGRSRMGREVRDAAPAMAVSLVPELLRNREWIEFVLGPPRDLFAAAVQRAMMQPAKRDGEFIA